MTTTINQLSRMIIDKLNYYYSDLLNAEVKADIRSWLSKLLRQDVEKNGQSQEYNHSFVVPLQRVDYADNCLVAVGCELLRTITEIPAPVRIKGDVQFKFVGTVDKRISFTYSEKEYLTYAATSKYTGKVPRYFYENKYIYAKTPTLKEKYLLIEGIFLDTEILWSVCGTGCFDEDYQVNIPEDMLAVIETEVMKTFAAIKVAKFIV